MVSCPLYLIINQDIQSLPLLCLVHCMTINIFFIVPTNCSGGINLGLWSATWTVIGQYATFTVSGSSTGGYVAIGFSDSRSMVRLTFSKMIHVS